MEVTFSKVKGDGEEEEKTAYFNSKTKIIANEGERKY